MRKLRVVLLSAAPWLLSGALSAVPPDEARITAVENGLRPPVLVEGDHTWSLAERMKFYGINGVSIAVIRDSKVEWAKGYGLADVEANQPVTAATLFQAGSISKPVSAMGALVLVEDGKLKLDGDINAYLKSWKVPGNEHTAKTPVTLEEILSHTAGLTVHGFPGYAAGAPVPTVPQVLDGAAPANTAPVRVDLDPGTQYRYSGGGYTIAQLAMADVTGQPYPALMQRLVLGPLGMKESTFDQPLPASLVGSAAAGYYADGKPVQGKRHVYPEMAAAGLWTTPSDLARFAIGIQKMLAGGKGPLSKAMAQNMVKPRREDYALGLGIRDEGETKYFEHGGADEGFQAQLTASEDRGYGAVIMTNSDRGHLLMPEILRAIAAAYYWEGYQIEAIRAAKLSPEDLAIYAGKYRLDADTVLVVAPSGGGLEVKVPLGDTFTLVPVSKQAFVRRDAETRYTFGRRSDGGAQLTVSGKTSTETAPRVGPGTRVPSEDLADGKYDEALAGYRKLLSANPKDPAVAETRLNQLGYEALQKKDYPKSIAIFRVNTELYPDSANTFDSLGEALEASGDKAGAIAMYKKCIEVAGQKGDVDQNGPAKVHSQERLKALGAS
ncbi:MAG TPA: serine hydrolase [Thermoanaerobaculia bacterium]|nr:serine hydrolase [Thermoanaerobaculia bacterium]